MAYRYTDYIHEADQAALEALKGIPGFTQILKAFMKDWSERQSRLRNISSYIRIDENQLPQYYHLLPPICEKLGIEVPELYLMLDVRPNAFTSGETKPYIVLTSGLLETLPEELIPTILAHECGHIACHHVLYRTMGTILISGTAGSLSRLPFGSLITLPLQVSFFYWMRCSEYSADRAAVLCDGSADKMAEVCMRLAGFDKDIAGQMNMDAFLEQAKEYRKITSENKWDKTLEFYLLSNATHPLTAVRALECTEWVKTHQFREILAGTYVPEKKAAAPAKPIIDINEIRRKILHEPEKKEKICPACGKANDPDSMFCQNCGHPLSTQIRHCPACGKELEGDEQFCPHCGREIKK